MENIKTTEQIKIIMKSVPNIPFFIKDNGDTISDFEVESISESLVISLQDLYKLIDHAPSDLPCKYELDKMTREFGEKCKSNDRIKFKGKYKKLL